MQLCSTEFVWKMLFQRRVKRRLTYEESLRAGYVGWKSSLKDIINFRMKPKSIATLKVQNCKCKCKQEECNMNFPCFNNVSSATDRSTPKKIVSKIDYIRNISTNEVSPSLTESAKKTNLKTAPNQNKKNCASNINPRNSAEKTVKKSSRHLFNKIEEDHCLSNSKLCESKNTKVQNNSKVRCIVK